MYTESSAVSPSDAPFFGFMFVPYRTHSGSRHLLSVVAGTSPDVYAIDAIPSHSFYGFRNFNVTALDLLI